jgi:aspartyl-tRNA(Asn)/glutamyl-tRNA(Gln) amidotransferase subunit A
LQRIAGDPPKLRHVFTEVFAHDFAADAEGLDRIATGGPVWGAVVSVKDLLDVRGHPTRAGSRVLDDRPAETDARSVARLRDAGALILGHTNMTELAYSGLGLNPHHGTPDNPILPGYIPGGSTSGGAVSVATGIADIAIGSDTGGSLRIPAAFTGTVGFKPTQASVSRHGCRPLSDTLDTVGPIARNVALCEAAWRVMAGGVSGTGQALPGQLVVPENFGMDGLDDAVRRGFDTLVGRLSDAGLPVVVRRLASLDDYKTLPVWHFSAVESRAHYQDQFRQSPDGFDPRVLRRMQRADEVSAVDYCRTLQHRFRLIAAFTQEIGADCLLMPTVAILPPAFDDVRADTDFDRLNLLALRNTTLANVMDGCSLSLPFGHAGHMLGAMLTAAGGRDLDLLATGKVLQDLVAPGV